MTTQKFTKNVVTILKNKKIKIGQFENECDMSLGRLSRYASDGKISLDSAQLIADKLGFTIDDVINRDWEQEFAAAKKEEEIKRLKEEQMRIANLLAELEG